MSMIRLNFQQILTPCIIEFQHSLWILLKSCNACQFLGIILIPHPITVTECWNTTLCTDACTSKGNYVLLNHHWLFICLKLQKYE